MNTVNEKEFINVNNIKDTENDRTKSKNSYDFDKCRKEPCN